MTKPAIPPDEQQRLATVHAFGVLDTPPDEQFERVTMVMPGMGVVELARQLTGRRPATKTIYMSGYSEEAILNQGVMNLRGGAIGRRPRARPRCRHRSR